MRWEDERYVRSYTRDTIDWLSLSFEAQGLLELILRKVDRAGVLELGRHGKRGVAAAVGHAHRWEVISPALEELLVDGCVVIRGSCLVFRNFIEAQEAQPTDNARQRAKRERDRDKALAAEKGLGLTEPPNLPPEPVTEPAPDVTLGMSRPAVTLAVTPGCHAGDVTPSFLPSLPSFLPPPPPTPSSTSDELPEGEVVVGEKDIWSVEELSTGIGWTGWKDAVRLKKGLNREKKPKGFDEWFITLLDRIRDPGRLCQAYFAYLRDQTIRAPGWPLKVFMDEDVYFHRLPPLQEAHA